MIAVYDFNAAAFLSLVNPDEQRQELVQLSDQSYVKLWERSIGERWGSRKLNVFRNQTSGYICWYDPKAKLWGMLSDYDEDKESTDDEYALYVASALQNDLPDASTFIATNSSSRTSQAASKRPVRDASLPKKKKKIVSVPDAVDTQQQQVDTQQQAVDTQQQAVDTQQQAVDTQQADTAVAAANTDAVASTPTPMPSPGHGVIFVPPSLFEAAAANSAASGSAQTSNAAEGAAEVVADSPGGASDDSEENKPLSKRKGKAKVVDTYKDTLDGTMTDANDLLKKLNEEREKRIAAEAEVAKQKAQDDQKVQDAVAEGEKYKRLHEDYKKRQRYAVRRSKDDAERLKQENDAIRAAQETDRAAAEAKLDAEKAKYEASQKALRAAKAGQPDVYSADHGLECKGAYLELIDITSKSYKEAISSAKASGDARRAKRSYEIMLEHGRVKVVDDYMISCLDKIQQEGDKCTYSVGSHNYQVTGVVDDNGFLYGTQKNMDPNIQTERMIHFIAPSSSSSSSSTSSDTSLDDHMKFNVLFGDSPVQIPTGFLDGLQQKYAFNEEHYHETSKELASLGELFTSLGNQAKYMTKTKCTTELYVKPLALRQWLKLAVDRGYQYMRIVMHGAGQACYDGVRDDPLGMDLKWAGMNGQAHGNGLYFGLSDHVTHGYNHESKKGTALVALMLTNKSIKPDPRGPNHHGGYTTFDSTRQVPYSTFMLSTPTSEWNNCIVAHDAALVLILGKVSAL